MLGVRLQAGAVLQTGLSRIINDMGHSTGAVQDKGLSCPTLFCPFLWARSFCVRASGQHLGDTLRITIKHGVRVWRRALGVGEKAGPVYGMHQTEV